MLVLLDAQGKAEELKDEVGQIVRVVVSAKQDRIWAQKSNASIDDLENIAPTATAYAQVVEENVPKSGNIILTSQAIIGR
ncbi:MAG: hypothetical protein AB9907_07740 [Flexilinea sp.]